MTMLDSCAQFLDDFEAAVAELSRAVEWYSAPDQASYLEIHPEKAEALGDACFELLDENGDDEGQFFAAAMRILRLAANPFDLDPNPGPAERQS
jgi:hypothetical protein